MAAKTYHHGELRTALVTTALRLLEEQGPQALSLRGLARAVGVSSMAPYHHFASRSELLAAVAAAGFELLERRKRDDIARGALPPREMLMAGTASYVAFVLEHPNLYRLMKGAEFADRSLYPELQRAAAAPAATLLGLIGQLSLDPGRHDPQRCARMLWGLAHGIGTLALDGQIAPGDADQLARDGAAAMVDGWLCAA